MSGIQIRDYGPGGVPEGEQTWDTGQLQQDFIVHGFIAGFVTVTRRADNVRGTLSFTHRPRVYFGFEPATDAVQACRDCGKAFPYSPDADRCPACVAGALGEAS